MAMPLTWEALENACRNCTACGLSAGRTNVVFGTGNRKADLMFIGEGPGEQEDLRGEPFVGPAGMLLNEYLTAVGIPREDVYIANIIKCRAPHNRDPEAEEEDACLPWLRRQTALVKPKIIVCLGRISAKRIIKADFKITREHGIWYEKGAYRMIATYHPSALLRDPSKRSEAYRDFMEIAEAYAALFGKERP